MERKKRTWLICLLVLLCAIAALCADSALRLVTTRYDLECSALPPGFDGFRVLQLSDVHGAVYGKDNARLLERAKETVPDIIVITGDLADWRTDLADTEVLLAGLTEIAPVYYVTGNHEWRSGLLSGLKELFGKYGVFCLQNEFLTLEHGGDTIVLAGLDDPNGWKNMEKPDGLAARIRESFPDRFVLLLSHRNDLPERYPELPVDLVLSGHGHGGVIRIPGVGGILGVDRRLFPKYDAGLYCGDSYMLVVSRGLGNSAPIPRIFNNPELVLAVLHSA